MSDAIMAGPALFLPPYDKLVPPDQIQYCPSRGVAAVWAVRDGAKQQAERNWLRERPNGVELVVILPPAAAIAAAVPLLRDLPDLRPRGVLPHAPSHTPEPIRLMLSSAPRNLTSNVMNYLTREGILRTQRVRGIVSKIFELAPTVHSISKLARKLYTSRRTLGRYFEAEGLPVPSHWLQFARLLYVGSVIQEKQDLPIFKAALRFGYPDGFTMSNQMKRLIGCRPSDVRENLGYEWIIEEWLRKEHAAGGLTINRVGGNFDLKAWLRNNPSKNTAEN
jgi:AraC-like DNA-binding protein